MSTGTVEGVGFLIANIYSVYWLSSGLKKKKGGGEAKQTLSRGEMLLITCLWQNGCPAL